MLPVHAAEPYLEIYKIIPMVMIWMLLKLFFVLSLFHCLLKKFLKYRMNFNLVLMIRIMELYTTKLFISESCWEWVSIKRFSPLYLCSSCIVLIPVKQSMQFGV